MTDRNHLSHNLLGGDKKKSNSWNQEDFILKKTVQSLSWLRSERFSKFITLFLSSPGLVEKMYFAHVHWSGTRFNWHAHTARRQSPSMAVLKIMKIWQPLATIMWRCYQPKNPGILGASIKSYGGLIYSCVNNTHLWKKNYVLKEICNIVQTIESLWS